MFVFGGGTLHVLSLDSPCQQDVFWHDGNSPGWMAHRLASSNSLTRYASAASWRHSIAADWNRRSVLKSWAISLTNLWKGNFRMSSAEVFWKWWMSCRATVPALYLWGFTCLPCILASCIFLFCSSVQSNTRWPSKVLSFVREMYRTGTFRSIGG